ncbi:MAG: hypothetical protein PVH21_11175 [Myxococcales bacterium]
MRRKWESGLEPQQVRCAWIGALVCIAMLGWGPAKAWAEEPEGEPAPEDTAIDQADRADVAMPVTHDDIVHAQESIDQAQRQLDEMKKRIGEIPVKAPSRMPGGAGLVTGPDGTAKKLQVSLNEDGSLYFRFATWLQVWGRAIQQNPGTVVGGGLDPDTGQYVGGDSNTWYGDVAIRRARFLMFGQIFPRTFLLMHIGINNQTFRNARKPQLFFHDAFAEFQLSRDNSVYFGGGILYWNGISRMTNASTITAMSLDLPIVNWPTIELSDQFARQMGFYLKGKFGLFDYRVSVTRPFTPYDIDTPALGAGNGPAPSEVASFRQDAQTWAYAGYFMLQFLDEESDVLPYTVGTYIGAKRVFNFGFGGYTQPWAMQYVNADGETKSSTAVVTGVDLFLDMPFKTEHGGAATWYAVYYYQNFGPNNIRNIGIMAEGAIDPNDNPSFNGAGNRYPMIGTGHTVYSELGFVLPFTVGQDIKFQPYVNTQLSKFEALDDMMAHFGLGLNMFVHNHNAKVSLEYRNRPIFNTLSDPDNPGTVRNRQGNSFILQLHLFI